MSAKTVVDKFGGQTALSDLIGKGQSTIAYWVKTGVIPARWQFLLLKTAIENNIDLKPEDFIGNDGIDKLAKAAELSRSFITKDEIIVEDSDLISPEDGSHTSGSENNVEPDKSHFLFYASNNGAIKVQVIVGDETVWSSQKGMAEIFGVDVRTVSEHLQNIFKTSELDEEAVIRKFRITASDGKNYETNFYNLDAIISIGYRVNSYQATQFRKWATSVLTEYLIKGFALDDERLKQGNQMFGKDYFDELLERIREIRASERRFYQKITDIYSQCSIDYDKNSPITQQFYAHVQDKLHYAIHGHTSSELIRLRADSSKPNMGLNSWKNERSGGKITKNDVTIGKNYLGQDEIDNLNRLVSMYLDFAENSTRRKIAVTMQGWVEKLDDFLRFNAYDVLDNFGKVRRDDAEKRAYSEYEKFRVIQDKEYKSDFDKVVDEMKTQKRLPKSKKQS